MKREIRHESAACQVLLYIISTKGLFYLTSLLQTIHPQH